MTHNNLRCFPVLKCIVSSQSSQRLVFKIENLKVCQNVVRNHSFSMAAISVENCHENMTTYGYQTCSRVV